MSAADSRFVGFSCIPHRQTGPDSGYGSGGGSYRTASSISR
jgi:hypothetical protein